MLMHMTQGRNSRGVLNVVPAYKRHV